MKNYVNISIIVITVSVIAYLSTASISAPTGSAPIGHFLMYFFLAGSFLLYFHDKKHDHIDAVVLAAITGLMFEFLQAQIPYRTFSLADAMINMIGGSLILAEKKIPVIHKIISVEDKLIDKALY